MSELERLKKSHAKLNEQLREAKKVIQLYRRWEHACDVECMTGDEADTGTMLTQASFASQDFVDKWENQIKPASTPTKE